MRALIHGGFHDVPPADGHVWVLLEEHQGQAPAMIDQPRGAPVVTDHDRAIMRDLVLGAFLAPPPERDDVGAAPFDTSRYRDKVHGSLVKQREAEMARYTTRVMASETRSKKKGAITLSPLAFQDARIVREVGLLAPEYQHWLRYAYADSKDWADEQGAVVALWARYAPKLGKVKAKTLQRAKGLAHLAVQDGKAVVNRGQHVHQVSRVRELLGVTESNWDKHWTARWKALGDEVLAMDREALGALCLALKGFRFVLMDREFELMNVELAEHDGQQECGCCGQSGPCDPDCDCVEKNAVRVPLELLRTLWEVTTKARAYWEACEQASGDVDTAAKELEAAMGKAEWQCGRFNEAGGIKEHLLGGDA